ncbi:aegerolysin family protein [Nonomuraea sp. NBC_01738]|uniref:aegerolysin family protein n=1 Tax=Nonomuraea sp. NBC_01738 TaxID=2976003 RepID=UPI002E12B399|nr:aegerolysin family protein [Nonomuraea sp. NBC_01738]
MAARSVSVTFTNTTGAILGKNFETLDHGVWTDDIEPPQTVMPGETVTWETESSGFMTGTEGRVQYRVGDGGPIIELHWDNPFSGTNTFDEVCVPNMALLRTGGDGENAKVAWVLENSRWHVTAFRPSLHGFHFANSWPEGTTLRHLDLGVVSLPIGDATNGLCGGMVYAALDLFLSGRLAPATTTAPAGEGDPLFDFFVSRLFDSFDLPDLPAHLLALMNPAYPDTDQGVFEPVGLMSGRSAIMIRDAWPRIKDWVDQNVPRPICLVKVKSLNPGELGHNHQVLVWGYHVSGNVVTLVLYDPNFPDHDALELAFDTTRTDVVVNVGVSDPGQGTINCFLTTAYTAQQPPP